MVAMLKSKRGGALAEGSKFITPVVCFPTTINPLIQNGYVPVFVDVELPNLNLNSRPGREAIGRGYQQRDQRYYLCSRIG
jgi:dTDP-4-dehydro-2,6-dideoxy-D-glucose 3-dehydratase